MKAKIRKLIVQVDETRIEMGKPIEPPTRRAVAIAVIENPFAGRFEQDLAELTEIGEELGGLLGEKCVQALGIQPANFVPLLDKLEQLGLTERRKVDGDRRSSALYLTRKGEMFIEMVEQEHNQMEAKLAARLGARRTAQLLRLLKEFTAGSGR